MIGFILYPFYGAAIACLILLTSFQNLSRRSRPGRVALILFLSLLAFILPFVLVTYRNAQTGVISAPASGTVDSLALAKNRGAVTRELWLREMVPPSWQPTCFSNPQYTAAEDVMPNSTTEQNTMMASPDSVCGLSDRIGTTNPDGYYATLTMLAASAITCAIVASFLSNTRKKSAKK